MIKERLAQMALGWKLLLFCTELPHEDDLDDVLDEQLPVRSRVVQNRVITICSSAGYTQNVPGTMRITRSR